VEKQERTKIGKPRRVGKRGKRSSDAKRKLPAGMIHCVKKREGNEARNSEEAQVLETGHPERGKGERGEKQKGH